MHLPQPFSDPMGTQIHSWDYNRDRSLENIFPTSTIEILPEKEEIKIERSWPRRGIYQESQYVITGPSLPYLPKKVSRILERSQKRTLSGKEFSRLMEYIADISINFYNIKDGKFVALGLNGRVVDVADSQLELLSKIQGKKYETQVFVWRAGSDVFSGWTS